MKATLSDFGIKFKQVPLLCDNESAVKLTNNLVQYLRTKHIDVRSIVSLRANRFLVVSVIMTGASGQYAEGIPLALTALFFWGRL